MRAKSAQLLYCLGEEAEDVLKSTKIKKEDEKKVYTTVLSKFESFFQVRKNVIFERACFNRRVQKREESVEQYIAALHRLADTCNYGDQSYWRPHPRPLSRGNTRYKTIVTAANGSQSQTSLAGPDGFRLQETVWSQPQYLGE